MRSPNCRTATVKDAAVHEAPAACRQERRMTANAYYLDSADVYYGLLPESWRTQSLRYRRFESLAGAVLFAVEELGPRFRSLSIDSGGRDYRGADIMSLYNSADFPLRRSARQA
jgi:hypothetical protein